MDEIDPLGDVPVYRQLADILRGQIERGELAPRRALPSRAALKARYGIGGQSADKAVALLREAGLVRFVRGKGTFVQDPDKWNLRPPDHAGA